MGLTGDRKIQHIADIVGEWGRWQAWTFWFTFCLWIITALNNMGFTFYAYEEEFWCSDVPQDYQNRSHSMKCQRFLSPNESCTHWNYSRKNMDKTIVTEFDLVCQRSNLASLTQSFYMWGYLISGLTFGYISDKYGRRPMIWLSICIEVFALSFSALSTDIIQYLISRLLIGMGSCGRTCAMRVLMVECCGPKYRSDIIMGTGMGWIVGYIALPLMAYLLRDYRYMHWVSVFLFTLMLVWFYFMWESPRWQIANGQVDKARETLKRAIKMNKKDVDNFDRRFDMLIAHIQKSAKEEEESKSKNKVNILDLFRTPNIRRYSLILCYSSVVISLVYYGFSLNMSDFGGNFYVTFVLSGLVELPAMASVIFLVRWLGRRLTFYGSLFVVAAASLAVIPLSANSWLSVAFALLGKTSVTMAWNALDIFSPEIFPTVLRNTGTAILLTIGRLGSSTAPFMKNLAASYSLSSVMVFYAVISCLAAVSAIYLPETKGREIPDTVEDAENADESSRDQSLTLNSIIS